MVSYIDVCERAVRAGGAALVERLGKVAIRLKSPGDLVTDADLAAQEIISRMLREALPSHAIVGEEDIGERPAGSLDAEFCWIIDPLDGTTNFAHNVPHFSVSVALLHRGELCTGSVFDPIRDELFSAVRGEGAWLNGKQMRTSSVTKTADALAGIGFPPGVDEHSADLQAFLRAVSRFQAVRRTGSAALNLAYVAMGRFDAAWSYSTRIWDTAAGVLLVCESGGVACSPRGGELELRGGQFLVSANETLCRTITLLLNEPPLEADR